MTCSQISGVTAAPRSRGVSRPALLAMADHVSADALVERQASLDFDDVINIQSSSLARSSKKRCRRSMARTCSARLRIITTKSRNTATLCSRSSSRAIAQIYRERYGVTEEQLALASRAVKNRAHARLNPFAQMRDDELTFDQARTVSDINLLMAPPLKVSDCSQITDGAAAWFCARNISSKKCNRAGPCDSSALRARRIICR